MRRFWGLCCGIVLAAAFFGCSTIQYTAGICDCDAPPVQSLMEAPRLPAHLCPPPALPPGVPAHMPHASE